MKLIAAVKRLNKVAGRRKYSRREPIALVWSGDDSPLPLEPEIGELRAIDVYRSGSDLGGAQVVRTVERLAASAEDLGFIYGAGGERLGVVVERDGSMITVVMDDAIAEGAADGG